MTASSQRGRRRDRGQSTVELALALPLICLLLLGVVQLAVVLRDQLVVIEAARLGARAAAVSAAPASAATGVATRAIARGARVDTSEDGAMVTVSVTLVNHTDVPLIGVLLPDVEVRGRASMLFEPP